MAEKFQVGRVVFGPSRVHGEVLNDTRVVMPRRTVPVIPVVAIPDLWPLIQTLERACWSRKWSAVKSARKAIEAHLGSRPHDPIGPIDVDGGSDDLPMSAVPKQT